MLLIYIFIFLISCALLFWAGSLAVGGLMRIAQYLHWREFVVAFFIMAFACSLPNLFVGINSAINKIPQLSFGDIVGGNVINLTMVVGLAVLLGGTGLPAASKMVQTSAIFSSLVGILPLVLIFDGTLSRSDGLILISAFLLYVFWLFSKEERFKKVYDGEEYKDYKISEGFSGFLKDSAKTIFALVLLLIASIGIVKSAVVFSNTLHVPLALIGILIVGLGDTLPEIYFSIVSARRGQNWMILGDIIGSVIYTSTFVLGIVVLIQPIIISNLSSLVIARIFLVISTIFFLIFVRSGHRITKKEGLFLLSVYVIFVLVEIIIK